MTTDQNNPNPHKFRYLLPPGSNFQFVAKSKICMIVSLLLMAASVGMLFVNKATRGSYMNWTIDFKGGTEIYYAFKDKADLTKHVRVDAGEVRKALEESGEEGFDVSDISWTVPGPKGGDDVTVEGMMVKTPRYSAITPQQATDVATAFSPESELGKKYLIEKASWSGERLYIRGRKSLVDPATRSKAAPVPGATPDPGAAPAPGAPPGPGVEPTAAEPPRPVAEIKPIFEKAGLELRGWTEEEAVLYDHADEGTGEYHVVFAVRGIDRQLELALEKSLPNVDAQVVQSYGVGAKAGAELRNDALKAIIYAMFLIALYLAFRFDLRYAPGAAFATIHDAIMVIGVFAVAWTEVSLTTVAAVLTVVGFSVNDTVVIFDRIRENQAKLKDKRLERIVDISLNETLVRSILTSATVFATTLIMNIFGDGMVRNFAFAMNVGVIVGAYSSLFLAAPIFLWISRKFYSGPPRQRTYAAPAIQAEE
jgi:preprotein translocase subunit SecF